MQPRQSNEYKLEFNLSFKQEQRENEGIRQQCMTQNESKNMKDDKQMRIAHKVQLQRCGKAIRLTNEKYQKSITSDRYEGKKIQLENKKTNQV